jgi:hypothetical protein
VLSARRAPRQAHNDVLERAAETGLAGLLAALSLAFGAGAATRARLKTDDEDTRMVTAAAAGALTSVAALSLASFPFDMPGTLTLAGISLGLVVSDPQRPPHARGNRLALAAAVASAPLLLGAVVRADRRVRASLWLARAERSMRADPGPDGAIAALASLDQALRAEPEDYRANLRAAQMLLRKHHPLDSCLAARQALASEPYSPNAWAALAIAELVSGDAGAARRDATKALDLLSDFPFALLVRARAEEALGDAEARDADRDHLRALATASPDADTARDARSLLSGT